MTKFSKNYFFLFIIGLFFFVLPTSASEINGIILANHGYVYGENLGWINFACDNCNVHVTDTGLTGYAWSRQYGWINLSPDGSGVTNNCSGELGGKAWSKSLGWIDFSGASINASGKFVGMSGVPGSKAGRINFDCNNCDVSTDWLKCSLRESPAQVVINSVTNTIPSITASITITNEGSVDTEYQYEWCVVSDINNSCGGGDDIYYSSAAKLITAGQDWVTTKNVVVQNPGTYYFKLVVHYGANSSSASQIFTAKNSGSGEGSGGGGGGGGVTPPVIPPVATTTPISTPEVVVCNGADFNHDSKVNSIDFSILLAFWKTPWPFKNSCVDINGDKQVSSVDFSILMYQWGKNK